VKSILRLTVNGRPREDAVAENALLIDYLRDALGLTGTKQGCDGGECGACTVLVDGQPRLACSTLAHSVVGREIETIEGLSHAGNLSRLQRAFHEHLGSQCGFCTPGMIMAAEALLRSNPRPDRDQIKAALAGNLCRCTGYVKIIESVEAAARAVEQAACAPLGRPEGRESQSGAAQRRTAVTSSRGEGAGGRAAQ
jgi:4-hydroxybenzoyl-CoA reductase subunit gamma